MEKRSKRIRKVAVACAAAILGLAGADTTLQAKEWQVVVGGESPDRGSQALAFLPNELWIQTNDSLRFTFPTHERHTSTFLAVGQTRPPAFGQTFGVILGCPGVTPDGSSVNGLSCVTSDVELLPESGPPGLLPTYTVNFPIAGNFKLVCLVHADMTGVVHVSNPGTTLPHDQNYYSQVAVTEELRLLAQATALGFLGTLASQEQTVGAGIGQIVNMTGLGSQTASLMRFLRNTIRVRVGDTVEWSNLDPSINHTVTFGTEPMDPRLASGGVSVSSDGARQATISSPSASVSSGFLSPTPQDRANIMQAPLSVPRFRVTFTAPGTYNYICAVHDQLGMSGTVIVY